MIVALVIVVVAALVAVCFCVRELRLKDEACDARTKRLEAELFVAVGRTDMVSLAISDQRPAGHINYITPTDDELRRERTKLYEASE